MIFLGNIRQTHIKNTAIELLERYPNQFSADDFQHNKQKVSEYVEMDSKLMRNKIAGYITRYLASRSKTKTSEPIYE